MMSKSGWFCPFSGINDVKSDLFPSWRHNISVAAGGHLLFSLFDKTRNSNVVRSVVSSTLKRSSNVVQYRCVDVVKPFPLNTLSDGINKFWSVRTLKEIRLYVCKATL